MPGLSAAVKYWATSVLVACTSSVCSGAPRNEQRRLWQIHGKRFNNKKMKMRAARAQRCQHLECTAGNQCLSAQPTLKLMDFFCSARAVGWFSRNCTRAAMPPCIAISSERRHSEGGCAAPRRPAVGLLWRAM